VVSAAESRRERNILDLMPQVRLIARRMLRGLPGNICLDDLVSAGTLGLISAVDNFQESNGATLRTYSDHKIRGAILDSLRAMDWGSRHRRDRAKALETTISNLTQRLHRRPTVEEIAADSCLSLAECHARIADTHALRLESLETPTGKSGGNTIGSLIPDESVSPPSAAIERSENAGILKAALASIPETDRAVLILTYFKELTRPEIAEFMGISPLQVTRLKERSMVRLRAQLCRPGTPAQRTAKPSRAVLAGQTVEPVSESPVSTRRCCCGSRSGPVQ
jgi:RNA polymerase sigma factor for flagellar operon FliA